jgi:hypothetical protein
MHYRVCPIAVFGSWAGGIPQWRSAARVGAGEVPVMPVCHAWLTANALTCMGRGAPILPAAKPSGRSVLVLLLLLLVYVEFSSARPVAVGATGRARASARANAVVLADLGMFCRRQHLRELLSVACPVAMMTAAAGRTSRRRRGALAGRGWPWQALCSGLSLRLVRKALVV